MVLERPLGDLVLTAVDIRAGTYLRWTARAMGRLKIGLRRPTFGN